MQIWPNFGYTVAYTGGGGGGSLITPSVTMSRTSGVAPLAAYFDATATTAVSLTSRPFHDCEYRWDFGDETVSTWAYGAQPGVLLKNVAFGPVASHIYESAGTFTPTLQVRFRVSGGTFEVANYTCPNVVVTAANAEWATTKTICISSTGDFTGAPAGAAQVTSTNIVTAFSSNIGSGNVRFLLRAGESWNVPSGILINQAGPSMVGSFGTGAKPSLTGTGGGTAVIFNLSSAATPTSVSDWRFQSLNCNGGANGEIIFFGLGHCSQMLIDKVDTANTQGSLTLAGSQLNGYNTPTRTHEIWDEFYINDSYLGSLYLVNGNAVFGNSRRMSITGSIVNTGGLGEHGIRMQLCDRGVFSHNSIQNAAVGKHHLTLRGVDFAGSATMDAGTYSEKIVVSDNKFSGGVNAEVMTMAAQFSSANERGRNIIVERNWFEGVTSTQDMVKSAFTDVTVRNNVAYFPSNNGGSFVNVKDEDTSGVFKPDRVNVYNNSVYHASTSSNYFAVFFAANNDGRDLVGRTFDVRNNILYAPSAGNVAITGNTASATITSSSNTSGASVSPLFATNPPTALAHFTPGGGSYANAGGTNVNICTDLYATNTQTTPDMGAVVI